MDFSSLPSEIQFQYLLGLPPKEILSYCQTSTSARAICDDSYFWDQKAMQDFGLPFSAICNMTPYWKYQFMEEMYGNPSMIGPLVRTGHKDLAAEFLSAGGSDALAVNRAISTDDIVTMEFMKPYISTIREDYSGFTINDPILLWFRTAFENGFEYAIKYLLSIEPAYLHDIIILDEILKPLMEKDNQRGINLLAPYIEEMRRKYPNLLRLAEDQDLISLLNYLDEIQ